MRPLRCWMDSRWPNALASDGNTQDRASPANSSRSANRRSRMVASWRVTENSSSLPILVSSIWTVMEAMSTCTQAREITSVRRMPVCKPKRKASRTTGLCTAVSNRQCKRGNTLDRCWMRRRRGRRSRPPPARQCATGSRRSSQSRLGRR